MHYWIDGYNLLFSLPKGTHQKESFEARRKALISEINRQAEELALKITLVFDGTSDSPEYLSHYKSLELLYTRQSADEAILERVRMSKFPQEICVVTSDKELFSKAKELGALTLSLKNFLSLLSKKHKKPSDPKEFQDSPQEIQRLLKLFTSSD
jgi:predicted RNA-binding protein with PIN domain